MVCYLGKCGYCIKTTPNTWLAYTFGYFLVSVFFDEPRPYKMLPECVTKSSLHPWAYSSKYEMRLENRQYCWMLCEFMTILVIEVDVPVCLRSCAARVGLKITTPLSFACEIGNKCGGVMWRGNMWSGNICGNKCV